jgi:hypothetical protein
VISIPALQDASKHDFRINEIFGAAEADHADLRFCRRVCGFVHFEFEKTSNAHVEFSGLAVGRWMLGVQRWTFSSLLPLIDCHVLVVLLQAPVRSS